MSLLKLILRRKGDSNMSQYEDFAMGVNRNKKENLETSVLYIDERKDIQFSGLTTEDIPQPNGKVYEKLKSE